LLFLHRQKQIRAKASIAATIGSVMAKILAAPLLVLPVNKRHQSIEDTSKIVLQDSKENDESSFFAHFHKMKLLC
jgi:hypothetical protein